MKKTTAEIRVSVVGPEAEAMARYIKADILSGNADTVERLIISNGELVISLSRPYDGPANVDGYQADLAQAFTATGTVESIRRRMTTDDAMQALGATDKPAAEEADDCDCTACQLRRMLQAKVAEPTEPAQSRFVAVNGLDFLAAMMAASKPKE